MFSAGVRVLMNRWIIGGYVVGFPFAIILP